jgi:TetR/AcrR family transcriptional repressor of mexJK operon
MSTPSHPPHEASAKRQAIVAAAARLFMADGYGKTSMDAIAREAAVSKATLYAHFASKDQLFATIVGDACGRIALQDGTFDTGVTDMRAALASIGERLLRFLLAAETQAIQRMVIAESQRFPELGAAFLAVGPQTFLSHLAEWLAAQSAAGRIRIADPAVAADQFGALLRPLLFLRALLSVPPAPSEAEILANVDAAVSLFLAACAARSEA